MTTTTRLDVLMAAFQERLTDTEAATPIWPRNAAALNSDPEGVMLSAAVTTTCDGCGQHVGMVPLQIEGYFRSRDGLLITESTWDRQHGCGTWSPPIVDVAVPLTALDTDDDDDMDEFEAAERLEQFVEEALADLRQKVAEARDARNIEIRERLIRELREALDNPDPDDEDGVPSHLRGSETNPGVWRNYDGQLEAWDFAAGGEGGAIEDTIAVTEADLA